MLETQSHEGGDGEHDGQDLSRDGMGRKTEPDSQADQRVAQDPSEQELDRGQRYFIDSDANCGCCNRLRGAGRTKVEDTREPHEHRRR